MSLLWLPIRLFVHLPPQWEISLLGEASFLGSVLCCFRCHIMLLLKIADDMGSVASSQTDDLSSISRDVDFLTCRLSLSNSFPARFFCYSFIASLRTVYLKMHLSIWLETPHWYHIHWEVLAGISKEWELDLPSSQYSCLSLHPTNSDIDSSRLCLRYKKLLLCYSDCLEVLMRGGQYGFHLV